MCKFMYNISTVSSVSVEVVNKIKFEFSKKKKKLCFHCSYIKKAVYFITNNHMNENLST